ncbi:DNA translocase FtsK [Peribacillus acanthi]|uniref:DNA translocase FtsK n=1 Tax=Peribacillus acanthi TaxID=2171554 RepID=UPI000D3E70B3|nr:DNA translocase FtsK [Peribacillus acanthi]
MKWLKKIKKWFQDEEVIEIEEIVTLEPKEHEQLKRDPIAFLKKKQAEPEGNLESQTLKNKDVEANVQYQYPKGNFRFPIIPDKEVSRKKPLVRRQSTTNKPENQSVQQQTHPLKEPKRSSKTMEQPTRNAVKTEKIVKTSTKPFSVTEIPSPVYGFKQRPETKKSENNAQEVTVEFELESNSNRRDISTPTILRKKENVISLEGSEGIRQVSKGETTVQEEPVIPIIIGLQDQTLTNAKTHVHEEPVVVQTNPLKTIVEDEQSIPAIFRKQESITYRETETEVTATDTEENEIFIKENLQTPELHLMNLPADTDTEEDERVLAFEDGAEHTDNLSLESETSVEGELPIRPKKHIPFNVVMLKHDKEKLTNPVKKQYDFLQTPSPKKELPKTKTSPVVEELEQESEPIIKVEEETKVIIEPREKSLNVNALNDLNTKESIEDESLPFYQFPSLELLEPAIQTEKADDDWLEQQAFMLNETLKNFNVRAHVVNVTQGPSVTRFEVQPEAGVKVNKITNLSDDIKLSLAAQDIRMEAPIPGKHTIGIEIPNRKSKAVFLREILESPAFMDNPSPLTAALGLDISGDPIVTDLRKMPHGLIAGATGSGKSVCINTMLVSLLYKATPQELKLLLIDPKMVELAPYNSIPHLVSPVITDVKAATAALKWAVEEMERRYELFAHTGVRDINRFNEKASSAGRLSDKLPFIVIIIDELADLMMMSPADVEEAICRIAQKARACGIHLIVATQRPSVDVITGLIKANIPTRIAFSVSSQVDSRTIIDVSGAEKLLGKGDMLFLENGSSKLVRLQGTFVSDDEIDQVVNHVKREQEPKYLFQQDEILAKAQISADSDELFIEACEFVVTQNAASTSSLQRHFRIGYNRAARLMEMLESQGVISEARGSRPRDVLMGEEEIELFLSDKPM